MLFGALRHKKNALKLLSLACVGLLLAGCSQLDLAKQGRHTAAGGVYKIGNPYKIDGDWYYPKENARYDSTGIASWYGSKFQGRRTANGEIFDMNLLTAAHPTLPLPIIARVTNLENGRSIVVRVNDRGPFKRNREIDMSQRGAEILRFRQKGTAKVRVQYMRKAPLYNLRGELISGSEPASYVHEKPPTPPTSRYVGAVPKSAVTATALDETMGYQRPKTLQGVTYFVQLGVFSDRGNALNLVDKLAALSRSKAGIEIEPVYSGGRNMYRVRLGPVKSRNEAYREIDRILELGHQDAIVIED